MGRRARAVLDDAHERLASTLKCRPGEVVFTSGGTESVNMAILGAARKLKASGKGRHLVCSSVEHHAVIHSMEYLERNEDYELNKLSVNATGVVELSDLRASIRPDTILVSIQAANNEVGSIQDVAEMGAFCHSRGILFHTDAVQWFGKMPFDSVDQFQADLVSICAHKLFGPKGSGALYIKSPLHVDPILFGGSHENERRAGTENLPSIVGLVECVERFARPPGFDNVKMRALTDRIVEGFSFIPGVRFISPLEKRLPNTASFVVENSDSVALLAGLDIDGVCASSGSACSAGSLEPSHVIRAMGFSDELANALVRFSLGPGNTMSEVEHLISVFPGIVRRVQHPQ